MAKTGKKDNQKGKKDELQSKKASGSVVKAKEKRKKTKAKKVVEKLGKDITKLDGEFAELQPQLVLEKENLNKMKQQEKDKVKKAQVLVEPSISQAKQVETTTEELANL